MATAIAVQPDKKDLPAVVDRFTPPAVFIEDGIGTKNEWVTACNVFYPDAASLQTVLTVFRYCAAKKIDPMIKPFYIVTIDNRDAIWPSINYQRILAHRTAEYDGLDDTVFGPEIDRFGKKVPEWCSVTGYRFRNGRRSTYTGKVYYDEAVVTKDGRPNKMWDRRPRGQMEKCAEAAFLRKGFPEEVGSEPTGEEMGEHEGFNEHKEVQKRAKGKAEKRIESEAIQAEYTEVEEAFEPAEGEELTQIEAQAEPEKLVVPTVEEFIEARIEIAEQKGDTAAVEELKKDHEKFTEMANNIEPQKLIIGGMKTGWKAAQVKAYVAEKYNIPFEDAKTKMTREQFDETMKHVKENKPV